MKIWRRGALAATFVGQAFSLLPRGPTIFSGFAAQRPMNMNQRSGLKPTAG
jgi:hypothetical protein